jgi:uncharacterized protein (DUF362 family)
MVKKMKSAEYLGHLVQSEQSRQVIHSKIHSKKSGRFKQPKPLVSVLKTNPKDVTDDYGKLMDLAEYSKHISRQHDTILKLNLSWSLYFPACSTEPWQLDGVLKKLRADKYKKLLAVENQTVVTDPWKGAYGNKWLPILKNNSVKYQPLTDVEWVAYNPRSEMLAMNDIFHNEILVPKMFFNSNVIHFPTVKTHGHTTTTGSMKNAFGGLIPKYRHHAHKNIHEILVDLLAIQQEIHKGIFAVMDGCVSGDGAGPRTMVPYSGDILLASADQVAIDSMAAKVMGFDPLKIPYIKMAHDRGLGTGDVRQIEIAGMDRREFSRINFHFHTKKSPIIRFDQILRKGTYNIKPIHKLLFHSPLFKSFIFASEFYHDYLWYPTVGRSLIRKFGSTGWGRLFDSYPQGKFPQYKKIKHWDPY